MNPNQIAHRHARPPRRRSGRGAFTLIETLVAAGAFALIVVGILSIMGTSSAAVDNTRAQITADVDANLAMQMIVTDVREATSVAVYSGTTKVAQGEEGDWMLITRPRVVSTSESYYNRFQPDTTNPTRYYLSDDTGTPFRAGTVLWQRQEKTGVRRRLRSGVRRLRVSDQSSGVEVSLTVEAKALGGTRLAELTQRVVYMRNK